MATLCKDQINLNESVHLPFFGIKMYLKFMIVPKTATLVTTTTVDKITM